MTSVAIVVTDPARFTLADTMRDPAELLPALHSRGADARTVGWIDPDVDWADFNLVVLQPEVTELFADAILARVAPAPATSDSVR